MVASKESSSSSTTIKAEVYDTDRFGTLYHGSRNPPMANLGLAAAYMISLFRLHNISFAFVGGWAIFLRGGQRSTQDIDLAVAGNMDDVKAIMLQEQRYAAIIIDEDVSANNPHQPLHPTDPWSHRHPNFCLDWRELGPEVSCRAGVSHQSRYHHWRSVTSNIERKCLFE